MPRVNVNDCGSLEVTVHVTGMRRFQLRLWLLGVTLRLVGWLLDVKFVIKSNE